MTPYQLFLSSPGMNFMDSLYNIKLDMKQTVERFNIWIKLVLNCWTDTYVLTLDKDRGRSFVFGFSPWQKPLFFICPFFLEGCARTCIIFQTVDSLCITSSLTSPTVVTLSISICPSLCTMWHLLSKLWLSSWRSVEMQNKISMYTT